jgi:hypothetical protein
MLTKKLTKTLLLLITFSLAFACEKERSSSEAPLAGQMEVAGQAAGVVGGQAAGEQAGQLAGEEEVAGEEIDMAGENVPVQMMDFDTMEIDVDPDMGPDMD